MDYNKIEILIEKYFQGETSLAEERELRSYFSSPNVAPHLEQYKAMFGYFSQAKLDEYSKEFPQQKNIKINVDFNSSFNSNFAWNVCPLYE